MTDIVKQARWAIINASGGYWHPSNKAVEAILAEIERLRAQHRWNHDMSTAPKGQRILAVNRQGREIIIDWGEFCQYNSPGFYAWMPLPPVEGE